MSPPVLDVLCSGDVCSSSWIGSMSDPDVDGNLDGMAAETPYSPISIAGSLSVDDGTAYADALHIDGVAMCCLSAWSLSNVEPLDGPEGLFALVLGV